MKEFMLGWRKVPLHLCLRLAKANSGACLFRPTFPFAGGVGNGYIMVLIAERHSRIRLFPGDI